MTRTAEQIINKEILHNVSELIEALYKTTEWSEELCDAFSRYDEDENPVEVFEYWAVSDWLADKLAAKGEMVLKDFLGFNVWGRTCTGQAISLDGIMQEIAKEIA